MTNVMYTLGSLFFTCTQRVRTSKKEANAAKNAPADCAGDCLTA